MISTIVLQLISELIAILFLGLDYFGSVKYRRQEACPISLSLFFKRNVQYFITYLTHSCTYCFYKIALKPGRLRGMVALATVNFLAPPTV